MNLKFNLPLVAAATALLALPACAGPPLITDDPDTPGKDRWEINLAYTLDISDKDGPAGQTWEHGAPLLDLNYGLFDNDQLKLEVPLTILDPSEKREARAGIGDALLGYKLRLLDQDTAPVSFSIYPQLGIPTGDSNRDLGTGSPSLRLPIQIGRRFFNDKLFLYADAGYEEQFARNKSDSWFGGIAAEYAIVECLSLCGELRYEHQLRGSETAIDDSLFNVGAKMKIKDSISLIGSIGRSFIPRPQGGSDLRAYIGMQLSF